MFHVNHSDTFAITMTVVWEELHRELLALVKERSAFAAVQSLPAAAFFTSSNCVISTVPSGNLAVIFSSPPMALTKS